MSINKNKKLEEVLCITNLNVSYRNKQKVHQVLDGINLSISNGEIIAVLGETGCGKSTLAKALISLIPNVETISSTNFEFKLKNGNKVNLKFNCPEDFNKIRGKEIGLVYQEAVSHLNPSMTCGRQLMESLRQFETNPQADKLLETLKTLGFEDPQRILSAFPHQLSGGECQRILLAMSALQQPTVLIVDEPTSSLDKPNEDLVISYLKRLNRDHDTAILFITHDISLAMKLADRVLVMKDGGIIDDFHPEQLQNLNEYTEFLIEKWKLLSHGGIIDDKENTDPIITAESINLEYASSSGRSIFFSKKHHVLKNITFELKHADVLGVFGVSGSGKTSLARAICGLEKLKSGEFIPDNSIGIQMVFQNPNDSLDPLQKVGNAIKEVLDKYEKRQSKDKTLKLLTQVMLTPDVYEKRPDKLSGGQKQRVCIARALAAKPKVLIFDEATSALDAPVKTEILELLMRLKKEYELTYIFITHDLSVIKFVTNRVIIMDDGKIVEQGPTATIINNPTHPVTKALLLQK